ncbi:MAG: hypothetical protein IME96_00545 [Proteobacteria bacterium]|nr:hypothetical protein [Pseudomonadota bacterium]
MKKIAQRKEKKQPKIKVEIRAKGLTTYGGLLKEISVSKADFEFLLG